MEQRQWRLEEQVPPGLYGEELQRSNWGWIGGPDVSFICLRARSDPKASVALYRLFEKMEDAMTAIISPILIPG